MSNRMRSFFTLVFLGFGMKAYAIGAGFYFGVMTGPTTNNANVLQARVLNSPNLVKAKPTSQIWGSRFFLGYQFNPFAGMEVGLSYFSDIHFNTGNVQTCSNLSLRTRNIDIVGKASLAYLDWFDIYGKAGVAIVYKTVAGAFNPPPKGQTCGRNSYTTKFVPTYSVGASYNLGYNWLVDVSLNTIMVGKPINNVTLLAVGISYHFADRYCGQFLCDD